MPDYRTFFDSKYLGWWHLQDDEGRPRDVSVTIARVVKGELQNGTKKDKKAIVYFQGKTLGLAANVTNCETIAGMYGRNTSGWIGKRITLFATKTNFGKKTVDCIRVRPTPPTGGADTPVNEEVSQPEVSDAAE